jgi:PKD repeat protein
LDDCTLYEPINNKITGSVFRIAPRHSEIIKSGEVTGYGHVNVQIKVGDETKNLACFVTMDHISILGEHQAPIADAGGPYSGYVHEPITFDASNSIDPDGSISLYEWDFDNDGIFEEKHTIPTIQHTFSIADKHSVRLRVTDVNDYQSVDTVTVDVFSEKNWLFLLYMDADNNLGDIANKDFQELIDAAPFAENVHILVLKDNLGPDNTRLYYIDSSHDSEMRLMPDWLDSEENMGNLTTLSDFLTWAYTYYQADKTFLTLWDHGDGWRGVCADETSNDYLNLSELDAVFSTGPFSDEKLNILGFADCSMATMATYYQLHEHTDFFIGSEQTGWGSNDKGLPWQFTHLIQQMNITNHPSIVTKHTVENMTHQINNSSLENKSHTWSVVRSNQLVQLQQRLDEIADGLLTVIENQETYKIEEIYQQTEQYGETIDLYHFFQQISNASLSSISSDMINQTVSQFTNTVISNQVHQGKESNAISVTHAHGLAVYFPETYDSYDSEYDTLQISTGQWDEFLRAYLGI